MVIYAIIYLSHLARPSQKVAQDMFKGSLELLPSLHETFGQHKKLMTTIRQQRFNSVLPFMLLPYGSLEDIDGIGLRTDACITDLLAKQGLERRSYSERLANYLTRHYGAVEDAPIGALSIAIVRKDDVNYPMYSPLDAVRLLEALEPKMMIIDLMGQSRVSLRKLLMGENPLQRSVRSVADDMASLESRLAYLETGLTMPMATIHPIAS